MSEQEDWHIPTSEIFKMIDDTKKEFSDLKTEMRETREIIKRYNGLRERIDDLTQKVNNLEAKAKGRFSVWEGIKSWGGWIISIITLLIAIWKLKP